MVAIVKARSYSDVGIKNVDIFSKIGMFLTRNSPVFSIGLLRLKIFDSVS